MLSMLEYSGRDIGVYIHITGIINPIISVAQNKLFSHVRDNLKKCALWKVLR